MAKMAYQRTGGPLLNWDRNRPPGWASGSGRSADARSLGSLGSTSVIPRAGSPEIIDGMGDTVMDTLSSANDAINSSTGRKVVSAAALFHGYKRTGSIGIGILYAAFGYVAPVATSVVAIAQGVAKPKGQ